MPGFRRRLIQLEKWMVKPENGDTPRWFVLHLSYSDGGEVFEIYPLEGTPSSFRRFANESEMDDWFRRNQRVLAA